MQPFVAALDGAARSAAADRARALLPGLRQRGVRRLAVTFVNHAGQTLVKVVPIDRLAEVAAQGVGFSPVSDAFLVTGAIDPRHPLARPDGDLRLLPDPEAIALLDRAGGWAWAPGDRRDRDGLSYPIDQRLFCRARRADLASLGVELTAGFELEWMLGRTDEEGIRHPGVDGGPYGADRLVEGLDYAAALLEALEEAGLAWLQFHPEYGPGQFELSLAPADPLAAADRLVLARQVIHRVSRRLGLPCSFSPFVAPGLVGNGGHLHISVRRGGVPLLEGGEAPGGLREGGQALIAGLLEHLPALLPIACPLGVSYERLGPGRWSAPFRAWGIENREAALRLIPAAGDGAAAHLELKVADPAANPYLLCGGLMAVLAAALRQPCGDCPAPVEGDPSQLGGGAPERLPRRLEEASACFAASGLLRRAMGDPLHGSLLASQQAEARRCAALEEPRRVLSTCDLPLTR